MSSLPISVEEERQCFSKLLVLSATRLKNIEAKSQFRSESKSRICRRGNIMSKNRCVKNETNLKTKAKHVEKDSIEKIGREISKRIYNQRFQKYLYYH
jgi:hypothetical protein